MTSTKKENFDAILKTIIAGGVLALIGFVLNLGARLNTVVTTVDSNFDSFKKEVSVDMKEIRGKTLTKEDFNTFKADNFNEFKKNIIEDIKAFREEQVVNTHMIFEHDKESKEQHDKFNQDIEDIKERLK